MYVRTHVYGVSFRAGIDYCGMGVYSRDSIPWDLYLTLELLKSMRYVVPPLNLVFILFLQLSAAVIQDRCKQTTERKSRSQVHSECSLGVW